MLKKGESVFSEIDISMEDKLSGYKKGHIEDLLNYIYSKDVEVVSDSAKSHFIRNNWMPHFSSYINKLKSLDDVKLLPPERMQRLLENMPNELLVLLTENTPRVSFQPDRIFFFEGSMIPTNYFVPVNNYKTVRDIILKAANEYNEKIPSEIDKFIIAYEGISKNIAYCVKRKYRQSTQILGPLIDYPNDNYNLDISSIGKGPVIIFANTVQTGVGIAKLIEDLKSANIEVYSVLAFADRGIGARQLFNDIHVKYETFLSKKDISHILEWRYLSG